MTRETISINASETGTGKTYMALSLAQCSEGPFAVICPKPTVPNWQRLIQTFGLEDRCLLVKNIEGLKTGRTKFLTRDPKQPKAFKWNLPAGTTLFIDEAHTYGGQSSQNAYALAYLKSVPDVHVHLMSATLADSPARFRAFGFLMGLHDFVHFNQWAFEHGCFLDEYGNLRFTRIAAYKESPMLKLHREIFPRFGIRLRIADIEGFPENTLVPVLIDATPNKSHRDRVELYMKSLEGRPELEEAGAWAEAKVGDTTEINENTMVKMLRERQRIELLKVPWLAAQLEETVEEGHNAAVFLNFKESIRWLQERLTVPSTLITGDLKDSEREAARAAFQSNTVPIIIATHGAGGTGIDLHDLNGRPRVSFISPCFSTVQFIQTLGRIHRAGGLSPAIQSILCMKDSVEEMVLKRLEGKLKNLSLLNDGDFQPERD